ncbi:MAG: hypothetical protein ACKVIQ_02075, partial [Acidimicrobiales bacterium]
GTTCQALPEAALLERSRPEFPQGFSDLGSGRSPRGEAGPGECSFQAGVFIAKSFQTKQAGHDQQRPQGWRSSIDLGSA